MQNFVVGEADDTKAHAEEIRIALGVFFGLKILIMITAINFYNQPMLRAVEIKNKGFIDVLATKAQPVQPSSTQHLPECLFRRSRRIAILACPVMQLWRGTTPVSWFWFHHPDNGWQQPNLIKLPKNSQNRIVPPPGGG